jgi:hypothetical protein
MSGLPQAWKAMFKEKERLAATVLTYLGRDECGRRESGSHGLADRNAAWRSLATCRDDAGWQMCNLSEVDIFSGGTRFLPDDSCRWHERKKGRKE